MRKLIAGFATSIDGYIEGSNGEYDWIIFDKEQQKELAEHWKRMDAMFYGRKTYEAAIAMHVKSKGKKQHNPFAHMAHYVFSKTLTSVQEGFILINGDTEEEVLQIKISQEKTSLCLAAPILLVH
ncbi:MAG: dihydrofolate reductase family protein [Chitinophagaceae bacterium]